MKNIKWGSLLELVCIIVASIAIEVSVNGFGLAAFISLDLLREIRNGVCK
jgi:hypothetical protein